MKIYYYTFGCKVNSFDSAAIQNSMEAAGFTKTENRSEADIFVVNSCTVTAEADRKLHKTLRAIKANSPGTITVLTGCMPQAFPEKAAQTLEADIVAGNANKAALPALLTEYLRSNNRLVRITQYSDNPHFEPLRADVIDGHTRAFLKIQEGCENYCAYCIIPFARGGLRSMSLNELGEQVTALANRGYREIVLTGINLASYGIGDGVNLADAVEATAAVSGIERVRLGSIEPELLDAPLIARLAQNKKLCAQFHLSLQSGCDTTLARMERKYTAAQYLAVAAMLRGAFETPTFTTDVMVGFPGETENEFQQSLAFVSAFGFLKCHVFPYSVRPGTKAASLPGQLHKAEKQRRAAEMARRSEDARADVLRSFIGKTARVIAEQPDAYGMFGGYTDEYLPVKLRLGSVKTNDVVVGVIDRIENGYCVIETGEIIDD